MIEQASFFGTAAISLHTPAHLIVVRIRSHFLQQEGTHNNDDGSDDGDDDCDNDSCNNMQC